ncbi:hypothetical protein POTOM_057671 [Populus tomentosa]|uniref:Protein kinase domain-containing protein n=1 Tax=Populus tomentosa TaxID=118781 RepID=A0A8X7XZ98_POPTO|nr:hypothetical protein POTOM_057671 [Populus tomentosa]
MLVLLLEVFSDCFSIPPVLGILDIFAIQDLEKEGAYFVSKFHGSTNLSTGFSQASGAIAAIWGEENYLLPALDDEALPDGGSAPDSKENEVLEVFIRVGSRRRCLLSVSRSGLLLSRDWIQAASKEFDNGGILLFGQRVLIDRLLPWTARVKIAIGMAQGLSYLHTMEKPIVFRDFKSSIVLLDETLAWHKWEHTAGNFSKRGHVVGTTGYVAPEYADNGQLYVKSNVYSFGVVLVEMLTGLRAIDKRRPLGQRNLVRWLKPKLPEKNHLKHVIDPRLEGSIP